MALLKELTDYRSKVMQVLCSNQKIVDLLNDNTDNLAPDRELLYKKIFPYAYTPETNKIVDTFICFRLNVPEVMNKTYKRMSLTFYVFTHHSLMRTEHGLRPDLVGEAIEECFNGALGLGLGRVKLEDMSDISPMDDYHGIAIHYSVDEFNRPSINGDKGRILSA